MIDTEYLHPKQPKAEEIVNDLTAIRHNPGLVIEYLYGNLTEITEGKYQVPNPNNAFSYLMESAALTMATLHNAHDNYYRNMYPRLANQYSHLYHHMFDEHYIGRFATPGHAHFDIYFKKEEVLAQLEAADDNGIKRIIIPRGSYITGLDYVFTLLYGIEIKKWKHGGIDILYRLDSNDPVVPLNSNIVKWGYVNIEGVEFFRLRLRLHNIKISQINDTLVAIPAYKKTVTLKDKYVHCRVYHLYNGKIQEIHTTHSDLVYDPMKPTAKLTYLENRLTIEIPPIYQNAGILGTQVYIEVYTTAGEVDIPLNEYGHDVFGYQWGQLENLQRDTLHVQPLENISTPLVIPTSRFDGGNNGESFLETRDRVINFAGYTKTPITPNQIQTSLKMDGYNILKSRDSLTARSYLAVKALPVSSRDDFPAGAAAAMESIKISLEDLAKHDDVRDNGRRMTITPDALFKINNGIVSMVNQLDNPKKNRAKYTNEEYINEINKLQYMFTPFYYVLDPTKDTFKMRAYYMDKPEVEDQIFIGNNETSGYSVSSDKIVIVKFEDWETVAGTNVQVRVEGYKVRVKTVQTEAYNELPLDKLFAQMAVKPHGEKHFAHVNGVLLGYTADENNPDLKEYVWEFTLKTKWDVTNEHALVIHDLYMYINEPRRFEVGLTGEFYFVYGLKNNPIVGYIPDEVDKMVNREIIDHEDGVVGIGVDKVSYRLGWHLNNFWSNAIAIQNQIKYRRYEADVPRVYSKDVYQLDAEGIYQINQDTQELVVLHKAGDPVLDENGNQILKARAGDIIIGDDGMPVIQEDRSLARLLDIFMIDGVYYFADHSDDTYYRDMVGNTIKDWVVNDLESVRGRLLENTLMYFYPKRTMGDAKLIVDGGLEIEEPMRMSFKVTFYMDEAHHNNYDLRIALGEMTSEVINELLTKPQVSTSELISILEERGGEDIVSVHVDMFGSQEDRKFTTFTTKDDSVRCSVKRVIRIQEDNLLKVVEDIDIAFIKHDTIQELRY